VPKSADPSAMAKAMHSNMNFKTVIGDLSYDKKAMSPAPAVPSMFGGNPGRPYQLL
jgi:hypothetical protein